MKKHKEFIGIGAVLIGLSALLHYGHYLLFHDAHHLFIFLVADIAFIPLEVFFVTVVLDKILERREKQHLIEKLNMLVGLFFSEVGLDVLKMCADADMDLNEARDTYALSMKWTEADFEKLHGQLLLHPHNLDVEKMNVALLKKKLDDGRNLLVSLIANPALLEHDSFSELLMAIMHLQEELSMRYEDGLTDFDRDHIAVDIQRAYGRLGSEWIKYMKHLRVHYPYLYLTALIKNPYLNQKRVESEKKYKKQIAG
jgi:hypothetical protein